jgi:hypothetical protein
MRPGLGASCEAAQVSHCDAQIFVGIDRGVVDAYFVVEVGTCGASAQTDVANRVAAVNVLSSCHREARQMAVAGGDAMPVIHHHGASVAAQEVSKLDCAIRRGDDGLPEQG